MTFKLLGCGLGFSKSPSAGDPSAIFRYTFLLWAGKKYFHIYVQ